MSQRTGDCPGLTGKIWLTGSQIKAIRNRQYGGRLACASRPPYWPILHVLCKTANRGSSVIVDLILDASSLSGMD